MCARAEPRTTVVEALALCSSEAESTTTVKALALCPSVAGHYYNPSVSLVVRGAGLEPASLAAKDPKSFVFANFTSRAIEKLAIDHLPGGCYNTGCSFWLKPSDFTLGRDFPRMRTQTLPEPHPVSPRSVVT